MKFSKLRLFRAIYALILMLVIFNGGTAAEQIRHDHYVVIRVVYATPEWHGFVHYGGGGTSAMQPKQTSSFRVFDVTVWEEIDAMHAYAFDESFEPNVPYGMTQEEWVEHREEYLFRSYKNMPERSSTSLRSAFLRDSLISLFEEIHAIHPNSGIILIYNGHGAGGGAMIEGMLSRQDAFTMLGSWVKTAGRKIDCIDFGGPCNKSSLPDLINFAAHSHYYVASDLVNGGYQFDSWNFEDYSRTDVDLQYPHLLNGESDLKDILIARINLKRNRYLLSRNNMVTNKVEQANYLYDSSAIMKFATAFSEYETGDYFEDLRSILEAEGNAELLRLYEAMIIHSADNRDFFDWEVDANGVYTLNEVYQNLSLDVSGEGRITPLFDDSVTATGTIVELLATSLKGSKFVEWRINSGSESPETISRSTEHTLTIDRDYRIEAVFDSWPGGATELGDSWTHSSWLGLFNMENYPWIYHAQHGYMYLYGEDRNNIWIYFPELGSLWTDSTTYPYFWSDEEKNWLFYLEGSEDPRWFYNWNSETWESY